MNSSFLLSLPVFPFLFEISGRVNLLCEIMSNTKASCNPGNIDDCREREEKKDIFYNKKGIISFHTGMTEYRAQVFRLRPPGTAGSGASV